MNGWRDGSIDFFFWLLEAGYLTKIACRLRELGKQHSPLLPVG
jgi:hypothetical protein